MSKRSAVKKRATKSKLNLSEAVNKDATELAEFVLGLQSVRPRLPKLVT